MALAAGARLGVYEILSPIGKGGMGEVYRARDTKLGRDVAIKVLSDGFSGGEETLARFRREAHLLASLNHPNVATLHGLEESDGQQFLVMELVEGETLAERLTRAPVSRDDALELFQQIASGLEAAHAKGIVHRDLKPANIKLTPDGTPKVLDFGLAKALVGEPVGHDLSQSPTVTRNATETGVLLGTAPYMSPEQARGKPVDKRCDIWAFGCCLYESLTGKTAFLGETVSDTIARILEREPDWEVLPPTTPPMLEALLRRCLQKNVRDRLHDIADARIELAELAESAVERDREPDRRDGKRTWVAMLVVAVAAGILGWSLRPSPPPARSGRFEINLPEGWVFNSTGYTREQRPLALSPDGQGLAYVADRGGIPHLFLRDRDGFESRRVRGAEDAIAPFFSPDGQWVGFFSGQTLWKVATQGGDPIELCATGAFRRGGTWTSNGWIVFSMGQGGLYRVSEDGGEPEPIAVPPSESDLWAFQFPSAIPGTNQVLFSMTTVETEIYDQSQVAVVDLETGDFRVLVEGGFAPQYAHSGHLVFARSWALFALPFDGQRPVSGAEPIEVLSGVAMSQSSAGPDYTISADGTLAFVPAKLSDGDRLVWVDRRGNVEPLPLERNWFVESAIAPSGDRIAFAVDGPSEVIWIYDIERDATTRLTSLWGNRSPQWTADGERVVFRTRWRGGRAIRSKPPDSFGEPDLLFAAEDLEWTRGLHPDGTMLALGLGGDIWVADLEEQREPEPLMKTPPRESHATFSPNGRWIAYVSDATGEEVVYASPFPALDRQLQVSPGGGDDPVWSPLGDEIFFVERQHLDSDPTRFMVASFQEKPARIGRAEFLFEGNYFEHYDVAPDAQRLLVVERDVVPQETRIRIIQNWVDELERLVPVGR